MVWIKRCILLGLSPLTVSLVLLVAAWFVCGPRGVPGSGGGCAWQGWRW